MADFVLRTAKASDIDDVMQLEALGFACGERESREVYLERIQVFPNGSLVAIEGGQCIACFFSEVWRRKDSPEASEFSLGHAISLTHHAVHGDELYIASMTLHPDVRGGGRGRLLLARGIETVVKSYPSLRSVILLVNETWLPARKIYEQSGFSEETIFADFFSPAGGVFQNGIVMRKELKEMQT